MRSSKSLRMASHRRSPSFLRSARCACSQRGIASRKRDRPFFVISKVRLRRHPSGPSVIKPSASSGRKFRVNVLRSIPMNLASAVMDMALSTAVAIRTESCVARSPTGRNASSYARVTARAAVRTLWQAQVARISRTLVMIACRAYTRVLVNEKRAWSQQRDRKPSC